MKKQLIALAALTLLTLQARATGGYECVINDKNLDFKIGGVLSHGIPGGPFQNYGGLKLKNAALGKIHDLEKIEAPTQFWQHGNDLKVLVYNESEKASYHTTLTLVIETKYCESCQEVTHRGNYRLEFFNANNSQYTKLSGQVTCSME